MICNNNKYMQESAAQILQTLRIYLIFFINIRYNVFVAAKVVFMMKKVNRMVGDHGVGVARAARPLMTTINQTVL